jgi:hypothetical protein
VTTKKISVKTEKYISISDTEHRGKIAEIPMLLSRNKEVKAYEGYSIVPPNSFVISGPLGFKCQAHGRRFATVTEAIKWAVGTGRYSSIVRIAGAEKGRRWALAVVPNKKEN